MIFRPAEFLLGPLIMSGWDSALPQLRLDNGVAAGEDSEAGSQNLGRLPRTLAILTIVLP